MPQVAFAGRSRRSYVYLPRPLGHFAGYDINGQYAGWLGKAWDPLSTAIRKRHATDNPYFRDCTDEELDFRLAGLAPLPTITIDRLNRRQTLSAQFDSERRMLDQAARVRDYSVKRDQAMNLLMSTNVAKPFDLRHEPDALRDRYGRNLFGQSLLMGRRLIKAGARFVTVAWDMAVRGDDTTSWPVHLSAAVFSLGEHTAARLKDAKAARADATDASFIADELTAVGLCKLKA